MKEALIGLLAVCYIWAGTAGQQAHAQAGRVTVTGSTSNGPLALTAFEYTAGAFCSLVWDGKEFIDAKDHGRCLQSAVTLNGFGEQWNPTEAGASYLVDRDLPGPSSSKLLNYAAGPDRAATSAQMAYWYPVNGQVLSNHIHRKYVRVMGNVVSYKVEFELPNGEQFSSAQFEVLCGYMPLQFSKFHTYDPRTGELASGGDGPTLQPLAVITATQDNRYAIGVWSPDTRIQYGYGRFPDVLKWTTLAQVARPNGTYRFQVYLVVGTVQDVVKGLRQVVLREPAD